MQKHGQVAISGLMLQEKAVQFWAKIPIYAQRVTLRFSQAWLSALKKRYEIKKFVLHGESGSTDNGEETEVLMQEIHDILSDGCP